MTGDTTAKDAPARIVPNGTISDKLTIPNALEKIRARRKQISVELHELRRIDHLLATQRIRS